MDSLGQNSEMASPHKTYQCLSCGQHLHKTQFYQHKRFGCPEYQEAYSRSTSLLSTHSTPRPGKHNKDDEGDWAFEESIRSKRFCSSTKDLNKQKCLSLGMEISEEIQDSLPHQMPMEKADLDYFSDDSEETSDEELLSSAGESGAEDGHPSDEEFPEMREDKHEVPRKESTWKVQELALMVTLFIMLWQKLCRVSDRATGLILIFVKLLIELIDKTFASPGRGLSENIPSTIYKARQYLNMQGNIFEEIVVCPSCGTLYEYSDCLRIKQGKTVSRKCEHHQYPNHPHQHLRQACGTVLLEPVTSVHGNIKWLPRKKYCYNPLQKAIELLVKRPGFIDDCNLWRKRNVPEGIFEDIYDGSVWKGEQNAGYFDSVHNLSFSLNVDWFEPFDHQIYSVGVMYLVINNLPRDKRFHPDNVIIVGILPGPTEPKGNINSFLQPLVDDLMTMWDGVYIPDNSPCGGNIYRGALHCLSSDIPATRKTGGFVGHGALKGCSKCKRSFHTRKFGEKANYTGYNPADYSPLRTDEGHVREATETLKCRTKAAVKQLERENGSRWSELFRLPYFKPVTFHCIDPMHNLLLGTAKHVIKVWESLGILDSDSMSIIQGRVNKIKVPTDIGRIPRKLASGFSGLTADQWRVWVTVCSLISLKDVIPNQHYRCWALFVHACRILCSRRISVDQLNQAHDYLSTFCKAFVSLNGQEKATINMHLHMHLRECVLSYGPVYSFWCFSFERYNGILGSYQNNNRQVETQMMNKFLSGIHLTNIQCSSHFSYFMDILYSSNDSLKGTVQQTLQKSANLSEIFNKTHSNSVASLSFWHDTDAVTFHGKCKMYTLDDSEMEELQDSFQVLFPETHGSFKINRFATDYRRVSSNGEMYSVERSKTDRSACIMAKWMNGDKIEPSSDMSPGIVTAIMLISVKFQHNFDTYQKSVSLARVKWLDSNHRQGYYGYSCQVWGPNTGYESFIPIQRISCRCALVHCKIPLQESNSGKEKIVAVIPLINKYVS